MSATVFMSWGAATARPYIGIGPTGWASLAGRLAAETERSPGGRKRRPARAVASRAERTAATMATMTRYQI